MPTAEELRALGNQKMKDNNCASALVLYTDAIHKDPSSAALYCNRAAAYMKLDCTGEAMSDLKRSLELDPNYVPSLCRLGFVSLYDGNPIASLENYAKAVQLTAQRPYQLDRFKSQLKESIRLAEQRARQQGYPQSYIDNIISDQVRIALDSFRSLPRVQRVASEHSNVNTIFGQAPVTGQGQRIARVVPITVAATGPNGGAGARGMFTGLERVFADLPNMIAQNIQGLNPTPTTTNTTAPTDTNDINATSDLNRTADTNTNRPTSSELQDTEMDDDPDIGIDDVDTLGASNSSSSNNNNGGSSNNNNSSSTGNRNFINRFFEGVAGSQNNNSNTSSGTSTATNNSNNTTSGTNQPGQIPDYARLVRDQIQAATQFAQNIARSQQANGQGAGTNNVNFANNIAQEIQRNFMSMINENSPSGSTFVVNSVGPDGQTHTFRSSGGVNTTTNNNSNDNTGATGNNNTDADMMDDNLDLD